MQIVKCYGKISKIYDHTEEKAIEPVREKKIYEAEDVTPWDDFNDKNDIWDVISSDFFHSS